MVQRICESLSEAVTQASMAVLMAAIDLLPDPEFHHLGAEDVYLGLEEALWRRVSPGH